MQSEKEQIPQEKIDSKNATSNEEKKVFDFKVNKHSILITWHLEALTVDIL